MQVAFRAPAPQPSISSQARDCRHAAIAAPLHPHMPSLGGHATSAARLAQRYGPRWAHAAPMAGCLFAQRDSHVLQAAAAPANSTPASSFDMPGDRQYEAMLAKFTAADLNGNGVIDREELTALLEGFESGDVVAAEHWLRPEEVDAVMQQYDTENKGSITFQQFAQLAKDGVLLQGTIQQYSDAFDAVDSDHDGRVTARELATLFGSVGSEVDSNRITAEFDNYDVEHTGSIGFYDFLRMFRSELLDLECVVNYLKQSPPPAEDSVQTTAPSHVSVAPGEVKEITSEQELDEIIAEDDRLTVLLAGFTWCRPCKSLQLPYQKLAAKYKAAKLLKFYGNHNENTKALFRDRLKARATPTVVIFTSNGKMIHEHTGANKQKLEYYLRLHLPDGSYDEDSLWPPYKLTEKELASQADSTS